MFFYRALASLPLSLLYGLAYLAYLVLYYVARYRRTVVRQNLSAAFPDKTETQITLLSKAFYRQLADVAVEIIKARTMPREEFLKRVKIRNPELLEQYVANEQSVILLTLHKCNWEWMLHGVSQHLGVTIDAVYKPLHNKTVDKLIYDIRSRFGSLPLPMEESAKDILRRRKEFRMFAMIADQSPIRRERGYWTQFMNREAAFYLGAEKIAQLTRFPVVFANLNRLSRGYYEVDFTLLAQPPYDKTKHEILDAYVAAAEDAIRQQPQNWLWSNRRWKRNRQAEEQRAAAQ